MLKLSLTVVLILFISQSHIAGAFQNGALFREALGKRVNLCAPVATNLKFCLANSKFQLPMSTAIANDDVAVTIQPKNRLSAKQLLSKYGKAGVDVAALLQKAGIQSTERAKSAGTAAIAYALHKAASPIRFTPTVILTPFVADFFSKRKQAVDSQIGTERK